MPLNKNLMMTDTGTGNNIGRASSPPNQIVKKRDLVDQQNRRNTTPLNQYNTVNEYSDTASNRGGNGDLNYHVGNVPDYATPIYANPGRRDWGEEANSRAADEYITTMINQGRSTRFPLNGMTFSNGNTYSSDGEILGTNYPRYGNSFETSKPVIQQSRFGRHIPESDDYEIQYVSPFSNLKDNARQRYADILATLINGGLGF